MINYIKKNSIVIGYILTIISDTIFKDILCTDDCEILNWVDIKIRGKLDGRI